MKILATPALVALIVLCAYPQVRISTDEAKILKTVDEAHGQADNWVQWHKMAILAQAESGKVDTQKAGDLIDRIESEDKSDERWATSLWTIPYSQLVPGELIAGHYGTFLMLSGTVATCRKRFGDTPEKDRCIGTSEQNQMYTVDAPVEIKAQILVEELRTAISHYIALGEFEKQSLDSDPFVNMWSSAWFDAEAIYCRHSPNSKYVDLAGGEKTCAAKHVDDQ